MYLLNTENGRRKAPLERICKFVLNTKILILVKGFFVDNKEFAILPVEELISLAIRNTRYYEGDDNIVLSPADEELLNLIELTNIKNLKDLSNDKKDCIICLEEFKNGDEVITLPCFHLYHKECIKDWLKRNNLCPICKHVLKKEEIV